MRILIFLLIVIAVFGPLNWVTVRTLRRLHPRGRVAFTIAAIAGNFFWILLPFVFTNRSSAPIRLLRALFAPPWFGWLAFTLLYASFVVLLLAAWAPFSKRVDFTRFARTPSLVFLVTTVIVIVVGVYQALVPLRVERVTVPIEGLPPALEGFRIVEMGDLHVGLFTRPSRLEKIAATARSLEPDFVAMCGDMIDDDPYFVPKFLHGLSGIDGSTPIIAVLGNHEVYGDPAEVIRQLRASRVKLLVNEGTVLTKEGAPVWIAGISDFAAEMRGEGRAPVPDVAAALRGRPGKMPTVLLSHQPKAIERTKGRDIQLILAAHTHGGQLGWSPLKRSLAGVFLPYDMGLYKVGDQYLYVNTGTGYWVLPFRFGMSPEITLIELKAKQKAEGRKQK